MDGLWFKTIRTAFGEVVKMDPRGEGGAVRSTLCVRVCVCALYMLCVFVFRVCCVCVCVKVKFKMSEKYPTGSREEAEGVGGGKR